MCRRRKKHFHKIFEAQTVQGLNNDLQAQFLVENGVIMIISDLLNYNNTHIKCEACDIVSVLASKGYTWPILENSGVVTNLARMVYEDAELRWAAVKVFKSLSCVAGEFNKILLSFGVMKTIFANLNSFNPLSAIPEVWCLDLILPCIFLDFYS